MNSNAELANHDEHQWKRTLNKISTTASVLCAIECALQPVILTALPLMGALDARAIGSFHNAGKLLASYVVLPVGGAAVAFNFMEHRRVAISGLGVFGLGLIWGAHRSRPIGVFGSRFANIFRVNHNLVSILGATALVSSNYMSHMK